MTSVSKISRTPVLIVGSGPIGLALAADLGWRGIACTVIEQNEAKIGPAKMLLVGVRTMEFCRRIGIAEKVAHWGFPPDFPLDNLFVTNLNGYEFGRIKMRTMGQYGPSRYSPEAQAYCPQTWFDPMLREAAGSYPHVSLRYQVRLEEFEQSDDGVRALVTNLASGQREIIQADYLIGCDGYNSLVRRQLGVEMRGHPFLDNSINIELEIPDLKSLHDKGDAGRYTLIGPEGTWATFVPIDGRKLWRITLYGANEVKVEDIDLAAAIRRTLGRDFDYEIKSCGHWVRRAVVADKFRDGRIFIAGDAGHTHPPNGGFGMNTGIGDANDLGWKLAATLNGWGGDHLLDSYDFERRPACHRAMNASLASYHHLIADTSFADIEKPTADGERVRRRLGDALAERNVKDWRPLGLHLGLMYDPSPIIVGDGTPRPADDTTGYLPISRPGSRAPHAWLPDGRSTLDLFGRNLTLLRFGHIIPDSSPLTRAAAQRGVPLDVQDIADRNVADLYESRMVLVRPDGHVAWRGDRIPADALALIDRVRGALPPAGAKVSTRLAALAAG